MKFKQYLREGRNNLPFIVTPNTLLEYDPLTDLVEFEYDVSLSMEVIKGDYDAAEVKAIKPVKRYFDEELGSGVWDAIHNLANRVDRGISHYDWGNYVLRFKLGDLDPTAAARIREKLQ